MACQCIWGREESITPESHPYRFTHPWSRAWNDKYGRQMSEWMRSDEAQGTYLCTGHEAEEGDVGAYILTMIFSDEMTALAFRMRFF